MKKTLLIPCVALSLVTLAGCGNANDSATGDDVVQAIACEYPGNSNPARPVDPPATTDVKNVGTSSATISMTAGDVEIALDRAASPCTVNSFESLAQQGYFDDTSCHRLTDQGIFILQCGDPSATGTGGPGYSYADETSDTTRYQAGASGTMTYPAGTVAMANAGADTNGSQFFLVWADSELPPDYTIFGTMDPAGTEIVAGIATQGVAAEDGISPIADASITAVTLG